VIEFKRFLPEHLNGAAPRNDVGASAILASSQEYLDNLAGCSVAISAFKDEVFLGCAGIGLLWPGVAEAWMLLTPEIDGLTTHERGIVGLRIARGIRRTVKEYRLHRLQTAVLRGDDRARGFIKWLGFEYEGDMVCYGPDGSTYMRYSKLWLS
jgi:hypothetical protein